MVSIDKPALLSTAYLPNIQYISKLLIHEKCIVDTYETYMKQSYRNRASILGANGVLDLTIPIIKPFGKHSKTKDIQIEYKTNWQHIHWQAIKSSYSNSPFFEIFEPELVHLYDRNDHFLIDFNQKALEQLFACVGKTFKVEYSNEYIQASDLHYDFRNSISPKKRLKLPDVHFKPIDYYQCFGHKFHFTENLSFIDLLMNEGPESIDICLNSSLPAI